MVSQILTVETSVNKLKKHFHAASIPRYDSAPNPNEPNEREQVSVNIRSKICDSVPSHCPKMNF